MKTEFYIDDEFQVECGMTEYEDKGLCDDCVSRDIYVKQRVKCVGWDGIYFCELHWNRYRENMLYGGDEEPCPTEHAELVEPFNVSRSTLIQGIELKDGSPDAHKRSNS